MQCVCLHLSVLYFFLLEREMNEDRFRVQMKDADVVIALRTAAITDSMDKKAIIEQNCSIFSELVRPDPCTYTKPASWRCFTQQLTFDRAPQNFIPPN
jgi:hypothetical protein